MYYENLTDKEKIQILQYIVGVYALAGVDEYADIKNFPKCPTKEMEPDYILMSNLLGVDFLKDIYDREDYLKFCQKTQGVFFIGDDLTQILCDFTREVRQNNSLVDINLVNELQSQLLTAYTKFLGIYELKTQNKEVYVDSGITHNGETLYKKVGE